MSRGNECEAYLLSFFNPLYFIPGLLLLARMPNERDLAFNSSKFIRAVIEHSLDGNMYHGDMYSRSLCRNARQQSARLF